MSKINLTPNASGTGTLTVTSPNTNSDYTLTLPAVTGTFNTSGAVNEVPAGTVSAPSIYFTGDTNTGIYSPGADTIAFTEGGTEAMRIDSSGNVLVGTSTTRNKLTVAGTATATPTLGTAAGAALFSGTDLGYGTMFGTGNSGDGWIQQQRVDGTATAYNLLLQPSGGNVGIGVSGPSCRLDVQNATQKTAITGTGFGVLNLKSTTATGDYAALTFQSSAGVPGAVMAYQQTASGGQIAFGISNNYGSGITSEAMRIDSSGNLQFNSGYGSVATAYGCRAWVNFNGTGTVAIRASGNVTSITDNGVGDYTVNFTTAMPDVNYAAVPNNHAQSDHIFVGGVFTYATGSVRMYFGTTGAVGTAANTRVDAANYGVAIFR